MSNLKLFDFTDSNWAGCLEDKKSTPSYVFSHGTGSISWSSKKHATTTLSSSEAEYAIATSSACQAIWLRTILADLGQKDNGAIEIFCDNKVAIAVTNNPVYHKRTKRIDIHGCFIRGLESNGLITLKYYSTDEQVADILTKSLPRDKRVHFGYNSVSAILNKGEC